MDDCARRAMHAAPLRAPRQAADVPPEGELLELELELELLELLELLLEPDEPELIELLELDRFGPVSPPTVDEDKDDVEEEEFSETAIGGAPVFERTAARRSRPRRRASP